MKLTHFRAAGLNCIEVSPFVSKPDLPLVVILHGMADWGPNYTLLPPLINASQYRYVFPTAPLGTPDALVSWFNLEFKGFFLGNLAPPVARTRVLLNQFLAELRERYQLPASRIAIGGFSLGGMLALDVGLHYPEKLGGIFSLSGFLVADNEFNPANPVDLANYYRHDRGDLKEALAQTAEKQVPVLVAHGRFDFAIPTPAATTFSRHLQAAGVPCELYQFWGGHQITLEELVKLNSFLAKIFK